MKRLLIFCAILSAASPLYAQSPMTHNQWEENNDNKRVAVQQDNQYANTEMTMENKRITFSDLPEVKHGTMAVISNSEGEILSQRRVDPTNNSMDIHWLQKGELYYVTLVYKSRSKKGFVLHI